MEHSETIGEIAPALIKARSEFPQIRPESTGEMQTKAGGYKYKYADLADIVSKVQPVLTKNGLVFFQSSKPEGQGLLVTTELLHKSGEWIRTTTFIGANPRASGSQTTYGRRYGLSAALGIVPDPDDDGGDAGTSRRDETNKLFAKLTKDSDQEGVAKNLETLGVMRFEDLDDAVAVAVVKKLQLKQADADVAL